MSEFSVKSENTVKLEMKYAALLFLIVAVNADEWYQPPLHTGSCECTGWGFGVEFVCLTLTLIFF